MWGMFLYSSLGVIIRWCETGKWGQLHNPPGCDMSQLLVWSSQMGLQYTGHWSLVVQPNGFTTYYSNCTGQCSLSVVIPSLSGHLYWAPLMWPKLTQSVALTGCWVSLLGAISKSAFKAATGTMVVVWFIRSCTNIVFFYLVIIQWNGIGFELFPPIFEQTPYVTPKISPSYWVSLEIPVTLREGTHKLRGSLAASLW